MIGIAQNDLGAAVNQVFGGQRFDRCLGADRHECRRIDGAVGCGDRPQTGRGMRVAMLDFKFKHGAGLRLEVPPSFSIHPKD